VRAALRQTPLKATRPSHFFRDVGPMPTTVTLRFCVPSELGETEQVLASLREGITAVELEQMQQRHATGCRIVGRRGVLRQSWRDSPSSHEPRRNLRPRVAARSKWYRIERLLKSRTFVNDYRAARARLLQHEPVAFPPGTYWLVLFAGATVVASKD
jgi:putative transposase